MFYLPEGERHLLKKPFGTLYRDLNDILPLLAGKKVYAVGDVVTQGLLQQGIIPTLAVIDQRSMRAPCGEIPHYRSHRFSARNPAGMITDELIEGIDRALQSEPSVIIVEGEEDLAVIPVVLKAAEGGILLYGQPHEGVVLREITPEAREEAKALLSHFIHG
jgi:Uncharacterized protein conserved in archaea